MLDTSKTIYQVYLEATEKYPENPAIYYLGNTLTYRDFLSMINKASFLMKKLGINKGETITIHSPNIPEGVATFYASSQLELNISFLHPLSQFDRVEKDIKEKGSKLLATTADFLKQNPPLLSLGIPLLIIELSSSAHPYVKKSLPEVDLSEYKDNENVIFFSDLEKEEKEFIKYPSDKGRIMLCSGGTSGVEKTIVLNDCSFLSLAATTPGILDIKEDEYVGKTMMNALPMFHAYGLGVGVITMLCFGGSMYLIPKFQTEAIIQALKEGHGDYMVGVPLMYMALLANPDFKGDILKNFNLGFAGGDFTSPALLEGFNKRLLEAGSNGKLYEGYGLTEAAGTLSVNTRVHYCPGSVGIPSPACKVVIVDENDNILPPNQIGEIYISGSLLMNGYLDGENPFHYIDGVKYLASGDMGSLNEEGFLFYRSRKKRVIKKKGFNIFPIKIEKVLASIPGVLEVSYLSRIENTEEVTYLFVHPYAMTYQEQIKAAILQIMEKNFFPYERPDHIIFLEDFPKTKYSKIDTNSLLNSLQ